MQVTAPPAPGTFCWADLGTTDVTNAKRFYAGLFGWTFRDTPMSQDRSYTIFQLDGRDVVAAYELSPDQRAQGVPPMWLNYITVASADEAARRAAALGANVMMGPFDVMDVGRMVLIADPTGAVVALWEARAHMGSGVADEPGTACWHELATHGVDRAREFYGRLLGWTPKVQEMGGVLYTIAMLGDQQVCGMFEMPSACAGTPPYWATYFAVADCDASAATAKRLGGLVKVPPTDIPTVGRFAVLQAPDGAVFSIIRLQSSAT
jgi:predicted enzyme related to lactoylglutathione lyase